MKQTDLRGVSPARVVVLMVDFQNAFFEAFEDIVQRNKLPVMAGGSALYVDSILNGYRLVPVPENEELREKLSHYSHEELTEYLLSLKPNQHNTTDLLERSRLVRAIEIAEGEQKNSSPLPELPPLNPLVIGIKWERSITRRRITDRLQFRLEHGLIEEVQNLHLKGISWQTLEYYGLEYRLVAQYLQNQITHETMFEKLNIAIHQFAKKQDTWLRRLQRNGVMIHWVDGTQNCFKQSLKLIEQIK